MGLEIHLLGEFSASLDGILLSGLNRPRLQALLAYLILHPQVQSRHHLAGVFWPESSEMQAHTNLRNLLHQMRQVIPILDTFLDIDTQTIHWRKDSPSRIDVHDFEQAIAQLSNEPGREKLESALSHYAGDLLPACYDEWILPERERLRSAFLSALEALVEVTESRRDYPAALRAAQRLVKEDPLNSAANHSLIRLYALNEKQPAALKAYQSYTVLLERELGTQPDPETRKLYEQLKRQKKQPNTQSTLTGPRLPLIGRQSEWSRIHAAWKDAAAGNPQTFFILGEAGIGKTRMVEELLDWANHQGIQSAVAYCYPAEGSLPFAPVTTWLRARPLPRLERIWLSEIARLLPELLQVQPRLSTPKPLTEAWQRQRMFEAVAKALLAECSALLMIIEDIHWCDRDTLEWIHYLLRSNAKAPLLLVATERSDETAAVDHPVQQLKAALASEGKINEVRLKALNEEDCLRLASQVAETENNQGLSTNVATHIFRETEGNPLFIVEMARLGHPLLLSDEDIARPGKVQTVLKWRIGKLSPQSRELACAAAVLGREFRLDVLQPVSQLEEKSFVQSLNELLQHQIMREQTAERYDFSHDKLRQAVLSETSAAHRRLLHRKAAEAYLAITGRPSRTRHAEIAHHYESAGMLLPAIQHFRLAAETAETLYSAADAIHNLQHALDLAQTCSAEDIPAREWSQMRIKMADLLSMDGQYQQAQRFYEEVLAQPETLSSSERTRAYCQLAEALSRQYRHAEVQQIMDLAERNIDTQTKSGQQEWLNFQIARANLFYWSNEPDKMDPIIERIAPVIEAGGQIDQLNALLTAQTMVRYRHERFRPSEETLKLYIRRLALLEKTKDLQAFFIAYFQYGFGLVWYGRIEEGRAFIIKSLEGAARCGARIWELRALAYLGVANRKLHNLPDTRLNAQQTVELSEVLNEPTYLGIGQANLGWIAWQEGKTAEAERMCRLALETWSKFGGDVFHGLAYWVLLAIAVERRDLTTAVDSARKLLDPNPMYRPVLAPCAAALEQAVQAQQDQLDVSALSFFESALKQAKADYEL